ncbi:MAG: FHA domain-containing protein [Bacteriovoracaceae bacterium]|nr:FHA domain-containing protein [Bacteriovoracaceae bacterium]
MGNTVLKLKNFEQPVDVGMHHRLMCLTGEDKGVAFFLKGARIVIGRGETATIQIKDLKASREHAELTLVGDDFVVSDLGSQNGIVINDLKVKQHKLKDGDKIIIGQTVFKYGRIEVRNKNTEVTGQVKLKSRKKLDLNIQQVADKKKIKPIHLIAGIGLILVLFMEEEPKPNNPQQRDTKSSYKMSEMGNEFEQALIKRRMSQDKELKSKLDVVFQRGLREYREGNYFRAMEEFNLALILSPNDGQALFYLQKTQDSLNKIIEGNFSNAQRDLDALKYVNATNSYCAIIRLLHRYPEDKRYVNAKEKLEEIEKKLGMEQGEISCLQKQ